LTASDIARRSKTRPSRGASRDRESSRAPLLDLFERFHPDVIAYETSYYAQQAASRLLVRHERQIRRLGKAADLKVIAYSPLYVRQQLCADAYVTNHMVARSLVQRFPELAGYRVNQTPRSERYWLNMFDAVAVVGARESRREADGESSARAV